MRGDSVSWSNTESHPPVWPEAAQAYYSLTGDTPFLGVTLRALDKQLHWFEANRNAQDGGFYYTDILNHEWESGVDEGVRFDEIATGPYACIDATSHLYRAYEIAEHWAMELQETTLADLYRSKRLVLQIFIQDRMFNEDVSYFFDIWSVNEPDHQHLAFEGLWPVVTGAATSDQAHRVIDRYVLSQQHFLTEHPLPTLAISDPKFELRMWRGPAWNSMTYWVALGCYRYGRTDAAMLLLEKALDSTAKQFAKTGTIWEFYHPFGETPDKVARKPHTPYNVPCRDYLGHNPLIAMAQLWDLCK
jgi:putative isomerase